MDVSPAAQKLELPWPPTVNTYWRHTRQGHYISKEGRAYRQMAALLARTLPSFKGKVAIYIEAYPPDKRRRDLDNLLKVLGDSLEKGGVVTDDANIDDLHIVRREVIKAGKVVISVKAI